MKLSLLIAHCLLSLLSLVSNVTIDFRIRRLEPLSVKFHSLLGYSRYSVPIDCLVWANSVKTILGIHKRGPCKPLSPTYQSSSFSENYMYSMPLTIIQKIDEDACSFPPVATFYHPRNKLKSVYFVTKKIVFYFR